MNSHHRVLGAFAIVVAVLIAAYASFGIPIACGSHGCIRKSDIAAQRVYDNAFARSTNSHEPVEQATLTTLVRRYLITHATTTSSVSLTDAELYRADILHATDPEIVQKLGFASFEEYDRLVLVPFLQQEALMKERHIKNPSALYARLAQEQSIFLSMNGYKWNKATGEVVAK